MRIHIPGSTLLKIFLAGALCILAISATAKDKLPETTHDGLVLQHGTEMSAVYKRPEADLGEYDRVALLDCYVAFRKNYQRDKNREAIGLGNRVSDSDLNKIRKRLAAEFREVFTEVLSEEGGHAMVSEGATGVLVIRPAIINLDVTAPDQMSAGRSHSFAASAGQMTLYMELYDGRTGEIIYRVIDPEAARDHGHFQLTNSVTNRAEADRILRKWAELLNERLKVVRERG